jgi:hypothetical protein
LKDFGDLFWLTDVSGIERDVVVLLRSVEDKDHVSSRLKPLNNVPANKHVATQNEIDVFFVSHELSVGEKVEGNFS